MLVSDYLTKIRYRLFDPSPGAGWVDSELIESLNEAIRATCMIKPDAYTLHANITLAAGVPQTLPVDGIALFDISQNAVSGRVVTQTTRSLLDGENRFWPAATQEVDVQHFTIDERAPRIFYVTPPNSGAGSVRALYGALPTAVAAAGDTVPLADIYEAALVSYAVSRALLKPSKRRDPAGSAAALNEWATMVGAKTAAQAALSPKMGDTRGPN